MPLRLLAAAAVLLAASHVAHADTLFNVTSTSGTSTTGTLDINTTTGTVVSSNLNFGGVSVTDITGQGDFIGTNGYALIFSTSVGTVQFTFSGDYNLQNYDGGPFSIQSISGLSGSGNVTVSTTSATPEPSSIALLGTGLLGVIGMVRKRFA